MDKPLVGKYVSFKWDGRWVYGEILDYQPNVGNSWVSSWSFLITTHSELMDELHIKLNSEITFKDKR